MGSFIFISDHCPNAQTRWVWMHTQYMYFYCTIYLGTSNTPSLVPSRLLKTQEALAHLKLALSIRISSIRDEIQFSLVMYLLQYIHTHSSFCSSSRNYLLLLLLKELWDLLFILSSTLLQFLRKICQNLSLNKSGANASSMLILHIFREN